MRVRERHQGISFLEGLEGDHLIIRLHVIMIRCIESVSVCVCVCVL